MTFNHVTDCESSKEILKKIHELHNPCTTDLLMSSMTSFFSKNWLEANDATMNMSRLTIYSSIINDFKSDEGKITEFFL